MNSIPDFLQDSIIRHDIKEYGPEIFKFMLKLEEKTLPVPSIIDSQKEITWKMRKMLILWLLEVHSEYGLKEETLFLTIQIIDRMASKVHILRPQYQLIGVAALWIAAKFEENHGKVPTLQSLCYITCQTFTDKEILYMERMILGHLRFDVGTPSCPGFIKAHIALSSRKLPQQAMFLASYILQLSLVHRRFVGQKSSFLSRAALILAQDILGLNYWISEDAGLKTCINQLSNILTDPPKQIFKKFSHSKYMNIATTAKAWVNSLNQNTLQNSPLYTSFGILTPPKEPGTPVWSKNSPEVLPSWDAPGYHVYSYANRVSQNSRAEYLSRNTSCMW